MSNKPPLRTIRILDTEQGGQFVPFPRFLVDSHMDAKCHRGKKRANRIPESFWKYTLILWRWITSGNPDRATTLSARDFPMRSDNAVLWTAAYLVSGLFDVKMGKPTPEHDQPTHFQYRCDASEEEWNAFLLALDLTLNRLKDYKIKLEGISGPFRVALAQQVDAMRKKAAMPPTNTAFLAEAPRIRDNKGRPVAVIDEKGVLQPQFYNNPNRQPWTPGHPRGCVCEDCLQTQMADEASRAEREEEEERPPY